MLESLGRDILSILIRYLTVGSKRTLLQVSKSMYWWIKPHLRIATCPIQYHYGGLSCLVCKQTGKRRDIAKVNHYVECGAGHRIVCHLVDVRQATSSRMCINPGCVEHLVTGVEYCDGRKPQLHKKYVLK
jgi:hypothetical protein